MLSECEVLIGYSPMEDELPYGDFLRESGIKLPGISVIADAKVPPVDFAKGLINKYREKQVCIFVPGREFDSVGTRHGRGGGWYDRFLFAVPQDWIRIGVLKEEQFSKSTLKRESWDEPMDMLLVKKGSSWKLNPVETQRERR